MDMKPPEFQIVTPGIGAFPLPVALEPLADLRRWVVWGFEAPEKVGGKSRKPPRQISGVLARNNEPQTWATFREIARTQERHGRTGIGLQLLNLKGFAALDLDNVVDAQGRVLSWAEELIRRSASYAETTPSGRGFRVLGRISEDAPPVHRRWSHPEGGEIEVYANVETGRYITVTGAKLPASPDELAPIGEAIEDLKAVFAPEVAFDFDAPAPAAEGSPTSVLTPDPAPKALRQTNAASRPSAPSWERPPEGFSELPDDLQGLIASPLPEGTRSEEFHRAVLKLYRLGVERDTALKFFRDHPRGPAAKYAGRLNKEFERSWMKARSSIREQKDYRRTWRGGGLRSGLAKPSSPAVKTKFNGAELREFSPDAAPKTPPPLSPKDAQKELIRILRAWLFGSVLAWLDNGRLGAPPVLCVKATVGLGKTAAVQSLLQEFLALRPGAKAVVNALTWALGDQILSDLAESAPEIAVAARRGRGADDPAKPGQKMCARSEIAAEIAQTGLSVQSTLCAFGAERCAHYLTCGYQTQIRRGADISIESHAHLKAPVRAGQSTERAPDLRIIDEAAYASLLRTARISPSILTRRRNQSFYKAPPADRIREVLDAICQAAPRMEEAGAVIMAALAQEPNGRGIIAALVKADFTQEEIGGFASLEETLLSALAVTPSMKDEEIRAEIRAHRRRTEEVEAAKLRRLWIILARDWSRGFTDALQLEVRSGPESDAQSILAHWSEPPPQDAPTLILDGEAEPEIVQAIWPGAEFAQIEARQNIRIVQVWDTPSSLARMTFNPENLEKAKTQKARDRASQRLKETAAKRSEVAALLQDMTARHGEGKALYAHYATALRAQLHDAKIEVAPEEKPGELRKYRLYGADLLSFGPHVRGLNHYKDHSAVVVGSRYEINGRGIEDQARAIFTSGDPLNFEKEEVWSAYDAPEGAAPDAPRYGVKVMRYKDARVEAIHRSGREGATRQVVGRLRGVWWQGEPKEVLLLSNQPIAGLAPDRLVSWREAIPDRILQAVTVALGSGAQEVDRLAERGGRIIRRPLLLTPEGLHHAAPKVFSSSGAVKEHLRRWKNRPQEALRELGVKAHIDSNKRDLTLNYWGSNLRLPQEDNGALRALCSGLHPVKSGIALLIRPKNQAGRYALPVLFPTSDLAEAEDWARREYGDLSSCRLLWSFADPFMTAAEAPALRREERAELEAPPLPAVSPSGMFQIFFRNPDGTPSQPMMIGGEDEDQADEHELEEAASTLEDRAWRYAEIDPIRSIRGALEAYAGLGAAAEAARMACGARAAMEHIELSGLAFARAQEAASIASRMTGAAAAIGGSSFASRGRAALDEERGRARMSAISDWREIASGACAGWETAARAARAMEHIEFSGLAFARAQEAASIASRMTEAAAAIGGSSFASLGRAALDEERRRYAEIDPIRSIRSLGSAAEVARAACDASSLAAGVAQACTMQEAIGSSLKALNNPDTLAELLAARRKKRSSG